jgi:hypothetical protein
MSTTKLIDAIESFCKEIDKMKEAILASDEVKPKEPFKPWKYRDIPIENRGELVAGNLNLSSWLDEINFVGFRYADGTISPNPTRCHYAPNGETAEVHRATHVVVEV